MNSYTHKDCGFCRLLKEFPNRALTFIEGLLSASYIFIYITGWTFMKSCRIGLAIPISQINLLIALVILFGVIGLVRAGGGTQVRLVLKLTLSLQALKRILETSSLCCFHINSVWCCGIGRGGQPSIPWRPSLRMPVVKSNFKLWGGC